MQRSLAGGAGVFNFLGVVVSTGAVAYGIVTLLAGGLYFVLWHIF